MIDRIVTIDTLMTYYDAKKVENYCMNCPNYNRIWSCPPHNFNTEAYLRKFETAHLYALKIHIPKGTSKEDMLDIFQKERRAFSDMMMEKENDGVALIAGNCYQCQVCSRTEGRPCVLNEKKRYSLEALGLIVGDISSQLLGIELKWSKGEEASYLVTVGAILK